MVCVCMKYKLLCIHRYSKNHVARVMPELNYLRFANQQIKYEAIHNLPVVLAKLSMTVTSSLISTGFAMCASYPDRSVRMRSSALACAVSAIAGNRPGRVSADRTL